jgi:head-tail adaptor
MGKASDLRHRLIFQAQTAGSDGGGITQGAWADQFTVWGQIVFRTGSETVIGQRLQGMQPVTIRVRYSGTTKAITPDMRVKHVRGDGVTDYYAIKSPAIRKPDDYGFLAFEAMKGAPDGG